MKELVLEVRRMRSYGCVTAAVRLLNCGCAAAEPQSRSSKHIVLIIRDVDEQTTTLTRTTITTPIKGPDVFNDDN